MTTRRTFLKSSLAAGATLAMPLSVSRSAHAAGKDGFRVGLIGCGGRGSGAAVNAMNVGTDVRIVAMADLFEDRLKPARDRLKTLKPDQVLVDDDHLFFGFDQVCVTGFIRKITRSAYHNRESLPPFDYNIMSVACATHRMINPSAQHLSHPS